MKWLQPMAWGWLNGWLPIAIFYALFGLILLTFPRPQIARLFSVRGWTRQQRLLSLAGKIPVLTSIYLFIFTPLKIGDPFFGLGLVLAILGQAGMFVALTNYRNTPADQPVTTGLYRYSRNPQWFFLAVTFIGVCFMVGSGLALLLFAISAGFYHFRILGEERACLASYGESYRNYMQSVPRYIIFR